MARANGAGLKYGRFLVRPYGLAGGPWELPLAGTCLVILGLLFVTELMTPRSVVSTLMLLPVLAAVWTLSNRFASLVSLAGLSLLTVGFVLETASRLTLAAVAFAIVVTALAARIYATSLAQLLVSHRHPRPVVTSWAVPRTLDGVDRFSHGVKALTRRELDVATLAAQGYPTGEIADQLHIGDRTVETHLSSVYSKLRIRSRTELIRLGTRLGDPEHALPRHAGEGQIGRS
jgi:DNA-binding NarL/FixJ family response regulator